MRRIKEKNENRKGGEATEKKEKEKKGWVEGLVGKKRRTESGVWTPCTHITAR